MYIITDKRLQTIMHYYGHGEFAITVAECFLNQAPVFGPEHAGFLKFLLSGKSVCVCVCPPRRAIKNCSRELKSELPIKQVLLPFSYSVWHLLSILLMGGALVMKRVVSYFQRRAR